MRLLAFIHDPGTHACDPACAAFRYGRCMLIREVVGDQNAYTEHERHVLAREIVRFFQPGDEDEFTIPAFKALPGFKPLLPLDFP